MSLRTGNNPKTTYTYTSPDGVKSVEQTIDNNVVSEFNKSATWDELHRYTPTKTNGDLLWIQRFNVRVPSVGCNCESDWSIYV